MLDSDEERASSFLFLHETKLSTSSIRHLIDSDFVRIVNLLIKANKTVFDFSVSFITEKRRAIVC